MIKNKLMAWLIVATGQKEPPVVSKSQQSQQWFFPPVPDCRLCCYLFKDKQCYTCEEGWEQRAIRCYYLSTRKSPWEERRRQCRIKGGDLVKIDSREEQVFKKKKKKLLQVVLTSFVKSLQKVFFSIFYCSEFPAENCSIKIERSWRPFLDWTDRLSRMLWKAAGCFYLPAEPLSWELLLVRHPSPNMGLKPMTVR